MKRTEQTAKDSPFGKGTDWHLNACVGPNGGPYDFAAYGSGYFEAGNLIGKHMIETSGADGEISIDVSIYPFLYMYRQGCELMMKHYIYDKKDAPKTEREHDLKKLWEKAKEEILLLFGQEYGLTESSESVTKIEDFILKLHDLDPKGEITRFPESLDKERFLQEYSIINIEPIYEAGLEVSRFFEVFASGREEMHSM